MYVLLLRGVNLGKRTVRSAELVQLASTLGLTRVSTYINSGNVICDADRPAETVAADFEQALADRYGFSVDVIVRTGAELAAVVEANPYPDGDPKQVTIGFTSDPIDPAAAERMAALAAAGERFTLAEREVYIDFAGGLARSKLAAGLPRAIGQTTTARNMRTVARLAELGSQD